MKRRRGFAMIYALTLLGLVAMALYALAAHFSFQVKRTTQTQADAQLHQLLLAGNDYVADACGAWAEHPEIKAMKLQLPAAPVAIEGAVSISLLKAEGDSVTVEVAAQSKSQTAVEQLSLKFTDGHWHVTGATLVGEGQ